MTYHDGSSGRERPCKAGLAEKPPNERPGLCRKCSVPTIREWKGRLPIDEDNWRTTTATVTWSPGGNCDPRTGIKRVLDGIKVAREIGRGSRLIQLEEIHEMYIVNSLAIGKTTVEIDRGLDRIKRAYDYAEHAFSILLEQYRKDGKTPIFAHSADVAYMAACLGARSDLIRPSLP